MGDITHLPDHNPTVDKLFEYNAKTNERGSRDYLESRKSENRPVSIGQEEKANRLGVDIGAKSQHDLGLELVEANLKDIRDKSKKRLEVLSIRGFKPGVMIYREPFTSPLFRDLYWIAGNVDDRGSLELYTVGKDGKTSLSKKRISIFASQLDSMEFKEPKKNNL
jgi:hypothetical protein